MKVDEQDYEEEDFDSPDESDDFEQIDDVREICDQVVWNVMKNDSQVYTLTTFLRTNQIICSLSDTDLNIKYNHVYEHEPCEESKFSQYYVTELFRRNIRSHTRVTTFDKQDIHPDDLIDYKHVVELQNQGK
ncbi:unnamed protein product [Rotaria sp. Silwood1]|nr:unnamed protein product [Rotaria sp. Silwood1]